MKFFILVSTTLYIDIACQTRITTHIKSVSNERDFGIKFDEDLRSDQHILMYKSLVKPVLEYVSIFKKHIRKIADI